MIILFSLGFFILLFIIGLLWILVPALYGLPPVPTNPNRIRKALQLVNLQPHEIIYDLGAGDGRVLLIAAREFNAQAVGIEIGPIQCALIWCLRSAVPILTKALSGMPILQLSYFILQNSSLYAMSQL